MEDSVRGNTYKEENKIIKKIKRNFKNFNEEVRVLRSCARSKSNIKRLADVTKDVKSALTDVIKSKQKRRGKLIMKIVNVRSAARIDKSKSSISSEEDSTVEEESVNGDGASESSADEASEFTENTESTVEEDTVGNTVQETEDNKMEETDENQVEQRKQKANNKRVTGKNASSNNSSRTYNSKRPRTTSKPQRKKRSSRSHFRHDSIGYIAIAKEQPQKLSSDQIKKMVEKPVEKFKTSGLWVNEKDRLEIPRKKSPHNKQDKDYRPPVNCRLSTKREYFTRNISSHQNKEPLEEETSVTKTPMETPRRSVQNRPQSSRTQTLRGTSFVSNDRINVEKVHKTSLKKVTISQEEINENDNNNQKWNTSDTGHADSLTSSLAKRPFPPSENNASSNNKRFKNNTKVNKQNTVHSISYILSKSSSSNVNSVQTNLNATSQCSDYFVSQSPKIYNTEYFDPVQHNRMINESNVVFRGFESNSANVCNESQQQNAANIAEKATNNYAKRKPRLSNVHHQKSVLKALPSNSPKKKTNNCRKQKTPQQIVKETNLSSSTNNEDELYQVPGSSVNFTEFVSGIDSELGVGMNLVVKQNNDSTDSESIGKEEADKDDSNETIDWSFEENNKNIVKGRNNDASETVICSAGKKTNDENDLKAAVTVHIPPDQSEDAAHVMGFISVQNKPIVINKENPNIVKALDISSLSESDSIRLPNKNATSNPVQASGSTSYVLSVPRKITRRRNTVLHSDEDGHLYMPVEVEPKSGVLTVTLTQSSEKNGQQSSKQTDNMPAPAKRRGRRKSVAHAVQQTSEALQSADIQNTSTSSVVAVGNRNPTLKPAIKSNFTPQRIKCRRVTFDHNTSIREIEEQVPQARGEANIPKGIQQQMNPSGQTIMREVAPNLNSNFPRSYSGYVEQNENKNASHIASGNSSLRQEQMPIRISNFVENNVNAPQYGAPGNPSAHREQMTMNRNSYFFENHRDVSSYIAPVNLSTRQDQTTNMHRNSRFTENNVHTIAPSYDELGNRSVHQEEMPNMHCKSYFADNVRRNAPSYDTPGNRSMHQEEMTNTQRKLHFADSNIGRDIPSYDELGNRSMHQEQMINRHSNSDFAENKMIINAPSYDTPGNRSIHQEQMINRHRNSHFPENKLNIDTSSYDTSGSSSMHQELMANIRRNSYFAENGMLRNSSLYDTPGNRSIHQEPMINGHRNSYFSENKLLRDVPSYDTPGSRSMHQEQMINSHRMHRDTSSYGAPVNLPRHQEQIPSMNCCNPKDVENNMNRKCMECCRQHTNHNPNYFTRQNMYPPTNISGHVEQDMNPNPNPVPENYYTQYNRYGQHFLSQRCLTHAPSYSKPPKQMVNRNQRAPAPEYAEQNLNQYYSQLSGGCVRNQNIQPEMENIPSEVPLVGNYPQNMNQPQQQQPEAPKKKPQIRATRRKSVNVRGK